MKFVGLTLVVTLACFSATSAKEIKAGEDGIYIITPENYKQAIRENKRFLMVFLSSSCKECEVLYPELVRAAAVLKGLKSEAKIGKIDYVENGPISEEFEVRSASSMRVFVNGEVSIYVGEHEHRHLVHELTKEIY